MNPDILIKEAIIETCPTINLFPPLDEDDLNALADDIRENGLQHPIVLDREGRLLDGRERLAACELASVERSSSPMTVTVRTPMSSPSISVAEA
ncbi:ParB N-terminal domain-containing protein [Streptomyces cucumeris]|uniref:ParB N-terminal domain-containing protein n=1 Tax=Streptomyces cucumeris TaxID=2962890 RepID=UPI003D74137A